MVRCIFTVAYVGFRPCCIYDIFEGITAGLLLEGGSDDRGQVKGGDKVNLAMALHI
jgi:hypothetical protein